MFVKLSIYYDIESPAFFETFANLIIMKRPLHLQCQTKQRSSNILLV